MSHLTEKILAIRIRQLRCLQGTTGREHEGLIRLREGQHGVVAVGKRGSWLHLVTQSQLLLPCGNVGPAWSDLLNVFKGSWKSEF